MSKEITIEISDEAYQQLSNKARLEVERRADSLAKNGVEQSTSAEEYTKYLILKEAGEVR